MDVSQLTKTKEFDTSAGIVVKKDKLTGLYYPSFAGAIYPTGSFTGKKDVYYSNLMVNVELLVNGVVCLASTHMSDSPAAHQVLPKFMENDYDVFVEEIMDGARFVNMPFRMIGMCIDIPHNGHYDFDVSYAVPNFSAHHVESSYRTLLRKEYKSV